MEVLRIPVNVSSNEETLKNKAKFKIIIHEFFKSINDAKNSSKYNCSAIMELLERYGQRSLWTKTTSLHIDQVVEDTLDTDAFQVNNTYLLNQIIETKVSFNEELINLIISDIEEEFTDTADVKLICLLPKHAVT